MVFKYKIKKNNMKNIDFNTLRDRVYKCACEHGFHDKELSSAHYLMWIITDLSKAVEADRKGQYCTKEDLFVPNKDAFENRCKDDEFDFKTDFEELIKDSVEDNLADTVIRVLDFAGMKNELIHADWINISEIIERINEHDKSFTELIYLIINEVIVNPIITNEDFRISLMIVSVFAICETRNIDLLWHIEQKMTYNELRPYKNGKKY